MRHDPIKLSINKCNTLADKEKSIVFAVTFASSLFKKKQLVSFYKSLEYIIIFSDQCERNASQ